MSSPASRPRGNARRALNRRRLVFALPGLIVAVAAVLMVSQLPAGALTVTETPTPVTGNATYFDGLGSPYGGCGLPQSVLESQNFVALNVYNTPGDYNFYPRPMPDGDSKIGMWNNGHNCGRWVQVTIGDYCTGTNDGAQNQAFCRNGAWTSDAYDGATLTMLVADSCGDSNAWCRDDPYHLDLSKGSLNLFAKNGTAVGDMYPDHWNNRHISWQFVNPPNYSGDIQIGFIQGAQVYWPAIAINHLPNGIHSVEYLANGVWTTAQMDGDMGQAWIIGGTTSGAATFQIRVRDADDALVNGGRVYSFSLPAACGTQCSPAYTQTSYTTSGGSTTSPSPSASATASPTASPSPSVSPSRSTSPSTSPSSSPTGGTAGAACTATYRTVSSWLGNFQGEVTVTNSGSTATSAWTVTLTNPAGQAVSQLWNGTVTTSGNTSTVKNASYNGALAPGASTTFGYLGSDTGSTPIAPTLSCAPS